MYIMTIKFLTKQLFDVSCEIYITCKKKKLYMNVIIKIVR